MENTVKKIAKMQESLEVKKADKNKLEGQLEGIKKQLEGKGFKDIEALNKRLDAIGPEIDEAGKSLTKFVEEFEETYEGVL